MILIYKLLILLQIPYLLLNLKWGGHVTDNSADLLFLLCQF